MQVVTRQKEQRLIRAQTINAIHEYIKEHPEEEGELQLVVKAQLSAAMQSYLTRALATRREAENNGESAFTFAFPARLLELGICPPPVQLSIIGYTLTSR
jgi:hypothetical protein